jgi:hypothetical protein
MRIVLRLHVYMVSRNFLNRNRPFVDEGKQNNHQQHEMLRDSPMVISDIRLFSQPHRVREDTEEHPVVQSSWLNLSNFTSYLKFRTIG